MRTPLLFITLWSTFANAAPPLLDRAKPSPAISPIVSFLSAEEKTAKGSLNIKLGETRETLEWGPKSPYYIVGVVFHSSALPSDFRDQFKGQHIIQFTFGHYSKGLQDKAPLFGSLGIVTPKIPSAAKTFPTVAGAPGKKRTGEYAQIAFRSPSTPMKQTDEDRLKNMYFAQEGTLIYEPVGKIEEVKVKGERGTLLPFRRQKVVIELNSTLHTPFNPVEGDVTGKIETVVYWPSKRSSQQMVQTLASSSVGDLFSDRVIPSLPSPTDSVNRAVSGSSKKENGN